MTASSETYRPVEEYPRMGTFTIEEMVEQRRSLAEAFIKGGFVAQVHPCYLRLLSGSGLTEVEGAG